ncbi:MAG: hypothetical protein ACXVIY_10985 [Mucilaginibacter sp.]
MKKLTIIALLSLCYSVANAQLTQSTSQIKQTMENEKRWRFVFYGAAEDGHMDGAFCLRYMDEKQFLGRTFYFVNDSCKMIKFSYLNKRLKDVMKDMDTRLIAKGDNIWIDENDHSKYELFLDKKKLGLFEICETLYPTSN